MRKSDDRLILVEGNDSAGNTANLSGKNIQVNDFYLGRYEVTQKEWNEVMKSNPSQFKGDNLPVETVSWYDCIEYCNRRSLQEGLQAYYAIDSTRKDPENTNELDDLKWIVTIHTQSNGYRLPTEAEWEYAAGGGKMNRNYKYSGSDSINDAAWYWKNSGDQYLDGNWSWSALEKNNNRTKAVGNRNANELGFYDMSGNVREWCWDWYKADTAGALQNRTWKGGGWIGADFCCEPSFSAGHQANGKGPDQGFRVCRSALQ